MSQIYYRTVSVEISGPDLALVEECGDAVDSAVRRITETQLKTAPVKQANLLYQTVNRHGPDRNGQAMNQTDAVERVPTGEVAT